MSRHLYAAALLAAAVMLVNAAALAGTPTGCDFTSILTVTDTATSYPNSSVVISVPGTTCFVVNNPNGADESYINWNATETVDVNQDGWTDLLLGVSSAAGGGIQLLLNDATGSGIVVYKTTLATGATKSTNPSELVTADVNGDGWPDIITSNGGDGTVSVLFNNKAGSFAAAQLYSAGTDVTALKIVDVNGDGHPDFVTADSGNQAVDVLLNKGDGTYAAAVALPLSSNPDLLVVGDLENSGDMDIVTADSTAGTVHVLLNNGHGVFAAAVAYTLGLKPDNLQITDVNGDGLPDIVAYNTTIVANNIAVQTESVLLNNGDGTFTPKGVSAVPNNTCVSAGVTISVSGPGAGPTTLDPCANTSIGTTLTGLPSISTSVIAVVAVSQNSSASGATLSAGGSSGTPAGSNGGSTSSSPGSSSGSSATTSSSSATGKASGGGALDWLSLTLLGAAALRRRRPSADGG